MKKKKSSAANMEKEFYPNACIVCFGTRNLKRCSRCQMISYYSSTHQQEHWNDHKDVCRSISSILKEYGITHLFEKLQGADLVRWRKERLKLKFEAERRCEKKFDLNDDALFKYPRSCFVCHESRQSLLKSCPGCPAASFCQNHPTSSIHNEDCSEINETFKSSIRFSKTDETELSIATAYTIFSTKSIKSKPISMRDFLSKFANFHNCNLQYANEVRLFISELLSTTLTSFLALKKLEFPRLNELTIHVQTMYDCGFAWEIIFHFLPHIKILNIIYFECCENFLRKESALCAHCKTSGKILNVNYQSETYVAFMKRNNTEPNILIHSDIIAPEKDDFLVEDAPNLLKLYSRFNCPIIVTTTTRENHESLKKTVETILENMETIFEGLNSFKSLMNQRNYDDGRIGSSNQYMLIMRAKFATKLKLSKYKGSTSTMSVKKIKITSKIGNIFYSSVCHVCGSSNLTVTCKRCRMISYCGKNHQEEHQAQHKDLCKVILGILNENGAPNLFDKLKTSDSNLWLRAKIQLLLKAQSRIGREFMDFERQMFLFPKTCFVCHESDFSVLKNCQCGIHLCKAHKSNQDHKTLCNDLSLAFKLSITERPALSKAILKQFNHQENNVTPLTMNDFIDKFIKFEKKLSHLDIENLEKILISDLLTRPLTLVWCLEELNYTNKNSLTIHVINAKNNEVTGQKYWKTILYRFHSLKSLKIIFIGPKITKTTSIINGIEFPNSLVEKNFQIETHALKYKDYIQSDSFIPPTLVIGFNLHLHEIDYDNDINIWKETILSLKKINAPFILTVGTEVRAQKEHEKFCQLFERNVEFHCCEENPFAGLIPERDFKNEKLLYSNQYVIIYNKLYEGKRSKCKGLKIGQKVRNCW